MLSLLALLSVAQASTTSFEHLTLIDGTGKPAVRDATVVIEGSKIVYAGPAGQAPKGGKRIDCKGKFAIPGLWDMHTHVDDPELLEVNPKVEEKAQWLPLFVLNGVTSAREMAGDLDLLKSFKTRIAKKELLGPRLWFGGPLVDGPKPMWPESIAISNAEEGRKAVRDLKEKGADFVKVYSLLPRDAFFAIADEAKKQGIPVCGHVPTQVTNEEAGDAGLNSIEHLLQLDRELVDTAKVQEMRQALPKDIDRFARFKEFAKINEACYSPEKAAALFAKWKAKGIVIDPTLVVAYRNAFFTEKDPELNRRLPFMPAFVREWWDPNKNVHLKDKNPYVNEGQQTVFRIYKRIVADLKKAGVPMMVGSDMGGNPHCSAGWGVHDELFFLVEAGLTPMEAIVAGTSNAARYLRVYDQLGSIEKGKLADFVILQSDPLLNVRNVGSIESVVYDGRLMDRKELNRRFDEQREKAKARL